MGGRLDWVRDTYSPTLPTPSRTSVTHRAFSPKVGLNFGYLDTDRQVGNIYLSASRSFKAPTLDQLFDQRLALGRIHPDDLLQEARREVGADPFVGVLWRALQRTELPSSGRASSSASSSACGDGAEASTSR